MMGYTVRSKRYRYTRWLSVKSTEGIQQTCEFTDNDPEELYDYETDPLGQWNRAGDEDYTQVQNELQAVLVRKVSKGWRSKPANVDQYLYSVGAAKKGHFTEWSKKNLPFLLFGLSFTTLMVIVIILIKKCKKKTQPYRKLKVEYMNEGQDDEDTDDLI